MIDRVKKPAPIELDGLTQEACGDIVVLVRAALQALEPTAEAMHQVRQLLLMIRGLANEHEGRVNSLAEEFGAHWIDHERRAFVDRMTAAAQSRRRAYQGVPR